MATYNIIKLINFTPTHIGTGSEQYDFSSAEIHSDTISAALAAIRSQLGKVDDVEEFMDSFTISSAFPFHESTFFLPRIKGKLNFNVEGKSEQELRKELKKIRFIEASVWQNLLGNRENKIKKSQLHGSFLLNDTQSFTKPYVSEVMQRVTIPRADGQDADPFYFNWTYFQKNAGMYCIVDAKAELFNEIVHYFELLGEIGIGTDKNVGGGKFDVKTDTITFEAYKNTNANVLLSLYLPTEEEINTIDLNNSMYDLLLRGGYMAGSEREDLRHLRKKSVYMFGVGSVFSTSSTLKGKVVDLTPEWNDSKMHPVYRSGKPFYLPIKLDNL